MKHQQWERTDRHITCKPKGERKREGEGGRREGNISKRGSRKEEKREKIIG